MKKMRKFMALLIATVMMASNIAPAFATGGGGALPKSDSNDDKCSIVEGANIPVKPVKPGEGETVESLTKNPDQPNIYTLHTDYLVERGVDDKGEPKYVVNYQPYIASVGEKATEDEKAKVNKTINLPDLPGYNKPKDTSKTEIKDYKINYDIIKNAADGQNETGNKEDGFRYEEKQEFKYPGKKVEFRVKHVFQALEDFTKYTNLDGSIDEKDAYFTTQSGYIGSTMEVTPLEKENPKRKGFVPEAESIKMLVPEDTKDFILEYRYNRAHFDVVFDTQGGTPLPARTLYYGQEIPKIADEDIPTKEGGEFQGWKPSVDISTKDGKTFKANEIIEDGTDAIKNLDANLVMPPSKVTFTAVWKDKEKADYAVQFWAEKADHADDAGLEKYDYIGTRVYTDQDTGSRPDLDNVPVDKIVFPDLDQARLAKIWAKERFDRGRNLYLNKFYVYNKDLTGKENADPGDPSLVKSVDSTGKTVYNIYYDRQVYDLYFTKSNAQPAANTFYPEIWGYDEAKDEVVKKGGPGNPYHYKARFNQLMLGWPNDAMQTKGFKPGYQSLGWGPNYTTPNWPVHLDTPPYRLNADEFLDMKNYTNWGGYVNKIDDGKGGIITAKDFRTLSFGIKQDENSMPHHMDFWMDGFKPGETIIRYDLYRFKADTNSESYAPRYPKVQGFTGKRVNEQAEFLDSDGVDTKNDDREAVTPFPDKTYTVSGDELPLGKMKFISVFFSNADDWGDPVDSDYTFEKNGYLKFEYSRNKYPLRFNYDPSKIKGDSEFNSTNQLDTFYEFPLKALSPDADTEESYNTENPANILDNPEKLKELNLTDLVFTDTDGKLKVKRPDNLSDQMVFKGWALGPAGKKMVWENPGEKMPNHPLNLYAIWDEPDYKWKVTFDPDGGKLDKISEEAVTQKRKTIKEGDIDDEKEITYAKKEKNEGDKQIFTVVQRQKLVEPQKPKKKGYDFLGWEVIHYKKDDDGNYTNEQDNSYREKYKVPELYSFGTDVVAPIYLKAIWVPNQMVDVEVEHYFLDREYRLDTSKNENPVKITLENQRANHMALATGDKQDVDYILATPKEFEKHKDSDIYAKYKEYNDRVGLNNSYFQTFRVGPEKIPDPNDPNKMIDNPNNVFKFFYRPFRRREYKVNYLDERAKAELDKDTTDEAKKDIIEKYSIIKQEKVINGNRDYDARNYKKIPGWVLAEGEKPQQQLVFDVNEETNEFLGINKTGKKEITFYYKDVRLIRVPDGDTSETPKGYVRVTFKAGENGKLEEGGKAKTVHYDVVKGLKFSNIPVPDTNNSDKTGVKIVPDEDYQFVGWERKEDQSKGLLGKDKGVCENYTYVAKFEKPQGKLTIKKVLENKPVEKQSTMARMAVPDPLKFKFKVTGPKINGSKNNEPTEYTEEFELAAGETKVLENLFDGDYKVEEIENHGYTPYYIEGDYDKTSSNLSADPIKVKLEKTDNKKDYEKTLTVVNKNVKPEEPGETNENIIDITVKKVWDGGKKPATTIELWGKGYKAEYKEDLSDEEKSKALIDEKVGEFTTTPEGDNEQSQTFKDLPKHDPSGREFTYYAMEPNVPTNYESKYSDDKLTITNKYTSPKIDVIGEKKWVGVPDNETRPTVKLELWRKTSEKNQGEKVVNATDLDSDNKANFGKQYKTDENGVDYIYFVKEVDESGNKFSHQNYSSKEDGLIVTNTYGVAKKDITATKVWKGDLEKGEKRPTIYFKLYRKIKGGDAQEVQGQEIKKLEDITEVTWKDQDIADDNGNEYTYSVKEVDVKGNKYVPEGYTATYSKDGLTVTNTKNKEVTPTPESKKITVKATKIWQGGPEEDHGQVNLQLIRKSSKPDSEEEVVKDSITIDPDVVTQIGENLPLKDKDNYPYTYKLVEVGVGLDHIFERNGNKYLSTVKKDIDNSTDNTLIFKVENAYQKPQDPNNIVAYKKWVNVPNNITKPNVFFQLQRNIDGEVPHDVEGQRIEVGNVVNQDGFIEVNFGEQDEKDEKGNKYTYSVRELDINGNPFDNLDYETTVDGLYVVNTYKTKDPVPEPEPTPTPEPDPTPTPTPEPDPIIPGEDNPEEPEEPDKPVEPDKPETPEKPEEKIPEKPEKEIPPVKTDTKKKSDQTGTKFVKKMEQTGTKIVSNVKNFLNPTTGIISNYELYIGLMAASSVGLFFTRDKKNEDEE